MLRNGLALLIMPALLLVVWLALTEPTPRADIAVACDQIRTVDPHRVSWVDEIQIAAALFEGLTRLNAETLMPEPGVAQRWVRSTDGRTYTFFLREDARWSDGRPVLAEHFRQSWLMALDPQIESQYASLLFVIEGAETYYRSRLDGDLAAAAISTDPVPASTVGVEAVDERTLRVRLAAPCSFFLELTAFPTFAPLPPDPVERFAYRGGRVLRGTRHLWTRPENIVTNGAFTLARWDFRHRLVLVRNPHYWGSGHISLETIELFITSSPTAALLAYETGRLDFVRGLEAETVRVLLKEQERGLRRDVHVGDRFATYFLRINCRRPPFDDANLRKALSLAIDREALCRHVTGLGEAPAYTLVPHGAIEKMPRQGPDGLTVLYTPPRGLGADLTAEQRTELAREYLRRRHDGGRGAGPVRIELAFAPEPVQQRRIAEAVQAMWERELGLRVELRVNERTVLGTRIRELDYDIARSDWYGDYMDPATFLDMFHSASGQNRTGWSDALYDDLIAAAAVEADDARRYELLAQAEARLCEEELPIIPLFFKRGSFLLRPEIEGLFDNVRDMHPIHRARRADWTGR